MESFLLNFERFEATTLVVVAARPNNNHSHFLGVDYELFDIGKISTPEVASKLVDKELLKFIDFATRPLIYDHFDQDLYHSLEQSPNQKAVILLYRPKVHSDAALKNAFLDVLKQVSRESWKKEKNDGTDHVAHEIVDDYFSLEDKIFATVDIMRRVNRPLIKLLDFKFAEFPCIVALKLDPATGKLSYSKM